MVIHLLWYMHVNDVIAVIFNDFNIAINTIVCKRKQMLQTEMQHKYIFFHIHIAPSSR